MADKELDANGKLLCLGEIVHNPIEVERLQKKGLRIITREEMTDVHNCRVMIRAHGEPPETYRLAKMNNLELIDASCPIVLKLQKDIRIAYTDMQAKNGQVVIFGNEGHAEVVGLAGQTNDTAIVIGSVSDFDRIDFLRPIWLFSQTTKESKEFHEIILRIQAEMLTASHGLPANFQWKDTICKQVSNRAGQIRKFAAAFEVIIFVSGIKSSNGMILYKECKAVNPYTYLVSGPGDLQAAWFDHTANIGICGATSTPHWLLEEIAGEILQIGN